MNADDLARLVLDERSRRPNPERSVADCVRIGGESRGAA